MSIEQTLHTSSVRPDTPDAAVKIQPKWLPWIRAGWILLTLNSLWVFVSLQLLALQFFANPPALLVTNLAAAGLPREAYFIILWTIAILTYLIFFIVAQLIFFRRPNERFAVFAAVILLAFGTSSAFLPDPDFVKSLVGAPRYIVLPFEFTNLLGWPLIGFFLVMYPDGQFVPRWAFWLAVLHFCLSLVWATSPLIPGGEAFTQPEGAFAVILYTFASAVFLGYFYAQFWRYRHHASPIQRLQIKWFVYGLALVFVANAATFTVELLFGASESRSANVWGSLIVALGTLAFVAIPLSIGIAILRYRLWEIDILIRRTLVYVPLTAILAGIFAASISITQRFFVSLTGQQSDAATVLTTLIVVAAFEPIKSWLQKMVERRFREVPDPDKRWKTYGDQVKAFVQMMDGDQNARRLLDEAAAVFDISNGAVYLQKAGQAHLIHTVGQWNNAPQLTIPLEQNGTKVGVLALGPRRDAREYTDQDRERLTQNSNAVAQAIVLVEHWSGVHQ